MNKHRDRKIIEYKKLEGYVLTLRPDSSVKKKIIKKVAKKAPATAPPTLSPPLAHKRRRVVVPLKSQGLPSAGTVSFSFYDVLARILLALSFFNATSIACVIDFCRASDFFKKRIIASTSLSCHNITTSSIT